MSLWPWFASALQSVAGRQPTVFIVSALAQAGISAFETGELRTRGGPLLSSGTWYFAASGRDGDYGEQHST